MPTDADRERVERIGNVLDHYELLPNDIKTDPGFDNLRRAIEALYPAPDADEPHRCDNCDGIDTDSCMFNPDADEVDHE